MSAPSRSGSVGLALKLGARSFVQRGARLLLLVGPAALLFSMLTFAVATEESVQILKHPHTIDRAVRIGSVEGFATDLKYSPSEVTRYERVSGALAGPAAFPSCYVDDRKHDEFACIATTRAYVQIHDYVMRASKEDLDRWDAVKNGVIVPRLAADKYHWKVGDAVVLHTDFGQDLSLVVTGIEDASIESDTLFFHRAQYEAMVKDVGYRVVWLLTDRADDRPRVMKDLEAELASTKRPHTLWKGEETVQLVLSTSKTITEAFDVAGVISLVLVVALCVTLLVVAFEQRRVELAALMAIGYRKAVLAASLVVEGALLMGSAAFAGAFVTAALVHDRPIQVDLVLAVRVSYTTAAIVAGSGLLLGMIASSAAALRTFRLDVLTALRS